MFWVRTRVNGSVIEASAEFARLVNVASCRLVSRDLFLFIDGNRQTLRLAISRVSEIERAFVLRPRERKPVTVNATIRHDGPSTVRWELTPVASPNQPTKPIPS